MSSKKPVSRLFIKLTSLGKEPIPRFDSRCGHFDKDLFSKSYLFLNDIQKEEREQLKREMKNVQKKDKLKKKIVRYIMISSWSIDYTVSVYLSVCELVCYWGLFYYYRLKMAFGQMNLYSLTCEI